MKHLWTYIDRKNRTRDAKYRLAFLIVSAVFSSAGFLTWLVVQTFALSTLDWMICFIAYPLVFSWLFVFLYSCRHGFHEKSHDAF